MKIEEAKQKLQLTICVEGFCASPSVVA